MARPSHEPPDYEVRCERCSVSFPVGTKHCLHCGERIGRPVFLGLARDAGEEATGELTEYEPMGERTEAEDAEAPRGRRFRFGITLLWLIAAVLSGIVRACQEAP